MVGELLSLFSQDIPSTRYALYFSLLTSIYTQDIPSTRVVSKAASSVTIEPQIGEVALTLAAQVRIVEHIHSTSTLLRARGCSHLSCQLGCLPPLQPELADLSLELVWVKGKDWLVIVNLTGQILVKSIDKFLKKKKTMGTHLASVLCWRTLSGADFDTVFPRLGGKRAIGHYFWDRRKDFVEVHLKYCEILYLETQPFDLRSNFFHLTRAQTNFGLFVLVVTWTWP